MSVTDMSVISETPSAQKAPRESLPRRRRGATREQLLSSGRALFATRGVHGVTTHDIAREAGVAAGTFYLHFPDKQAMFRELALEAVATLGERLSQSTQAAPDIPTRVRNHAEALIGFAEEHQDFVRILFSPDADAAAVESVVLDTLAVAIAERRRKRIAAGETPAALDPAVLSQALVGMMARVVAWWAEDPRRATREQVIETLTRIQLSGTDPG